jgi:hypothetical protein
MAAIAGLRALLTLPGMTPTEANKQTGEVPMAGVTPQTI